MTPLIISRFLALLASGAFTGILLGDRVGMTPVRPQLPPGSFIQLQQEIHVSFVPLMPVLMIVSILAGAATVTLLRRHLRSIPFLLSTGGTVCMLAVFGLTRVFNVPINDQLMTWQAAAPPPDLMALWAPWEQSHAIRTILAVAGFACHCGAAAVRDMPVP